MIARTVLYLITEAYKDEFLAKVHKNLRNRADALVRRAQGIFSKPNQLNWFLRLITPEDLIDTGNTMLNRFEHYFSLPIDAIHNFSFGSLSYGDATDKLHELERKWQERQSRLIPIEDAEARDSWGHGAPEDIVTFPDGFRWTNLHTAYSKSEAKAMGHCGNEPRSGTDDTILSLRQLIVQDGYEYLMPHATFVLMGNRYLRELKGFQNHKLASRYMPYVVELFKQYHLIRGIDNNGSYRPESDVMWKDFSPEQLQDILRSNPEIKDGYARYYASGEDGEYLIRDGVLTVSEGGKVFCVESGRSKKYYNRDQQLHRDDGPAIVEGQFRYWYRNGVLHRDDGPAIEDEYGAKEWRRNGKKHRDDGPAVEEDGRKEWWVDGRRHREDGPAYIDKYGGTMWIRNDLLHREDGPAVIDRDGEKTWYRNGIKVIPKDDTVAQYEERIRRGEIAE